MSNICDYGKKKKKKKCVKHHMEVLQAKNNYRFAVACWHSGVGAAEGAICSGWRKPECSKLCECWSLVCQVC